MADNTTFEEILMENINECPKVEKEYFEPESSKMKLEAKACEKS